MNSRAFMPGSQAFGLGETARMEAGRFRRLVAALIDYSIIILTHLIFFGGIGAFLALLSPSGTAMERFEELEKAILRPDTVPLTFLLACVFLSFFPALLLYAMETFVAAGPGKLILGLRICQQNGKPANRGILFARSCLKYPTPMISIVGVVMISFQEVDKYVDKHPGFALLDTASSVAGVIVLIGTLMIFGPKGETLWDKLTLTSVYRIRGAKRGKKDKDAHRVIKRRSRAAEELLYK